MLPAATQASMHLGTTHSQAGEALKRPEGGQEAAAPRRACASVALGSAENRGLRKGAKSAFNDRLEEDVVEKVNLCAVAASIITGASRYFALSSSLDSRGPRFEDAGLRSNGGGKLVQRGDRRRG